MLVRFAIAACFLMVSTAKLDAQALRDVAPTEPAARDQASDQAARGAQTTTREEPGYLGLITDDRRDSGSGIRVVKVVQGSPAATAGFRLDDLILAIDNIDVNSLDQMARHLEPRMAGDRLRFDVERAGDRLTLDVTLATRPPRDQREFDFGRIPERLPLPVGGPTLADSDLLPGLTASRGQLLGLRTAPVTEEMRQRLTLRESSGAVVVSRVVGSPAERAGIPLDAVIVGVDGQPVRSPLDLARLIAAAEAGKEVEIAFVQRGEEQVAKVRLADVDGARNVKSDRPASETIEAAPGSAVRRVELLERQVRELEQRVRHLEQLLRQNN